MSTGNSPAPDDLSANQAAIYYTDAVMGHVFTAALRAVVACGVPDKMADGPLPVAELAERAGVHEGNLLRVLRVLATRGVVEELEGGHFLLTERGQPLRSDVPLSAAPVILMTTERSMWQALGELDRSLRQGGPVYEELFGMSFFEHAARDESAAAAFHNGIAALSDQENGPIAAAYDFPESGTVVDVGGGRGGLLLEILRRRPGLRGVLLDEQHVVSAHVLDTDETEGRWELAPGDFFAAAPPADLYTIKRVLHDWDDERCVTILRNCRRAMAPGGRVLVIEGVVLPGNDPHQVRDVDVLLMPVLPGKERTQAEFERLLAAADLRLTQVVATGTAAAILEARPA